MMFLCSLLFAVFAQALEKSVLVFSSGQRASVEIAKTPAEREQGLMYRTSLAKDAGMLFIFPQEQHLSFWMKNTYIPLTIGFFDANKKLLETKDMKPNLGPVADSKLVSYVSSKPAKYALEMELGWFTKNKIAVGTKFQLKSR